MSANASAAGASLLAEKPKKVDLETAGLSPAERRAAIIQRLGLFAAPLFIGVLAVALYIYYQSLDLANAVIQQRAALDWSTRLQPQAITTIEIAAYSTVLVIAIAVPLGILLTRPFMRKVSGGDRKSVV